MSQVDSAATFIQSIRAARSDGFISNEELQQPLAQFAAADDVSDDIKGHVVNDLLMTARSRGRRGGLRLGAGAADSMTRFIGTHDQGEPGLWLDPPRRSTDPVSRFVNEIRREIKSGVSGNEMDRALQILENAPTRELRAHVAENLLRAHHRNSRDVRLSSFAEDRLDDFVREQDPDRQGLGWFEPAQ